MNALDLLKKMNSTVTYCIASFAVGAILCYTTMSSKQLDKTVEEKYQLQISQLQQENKQIQQKYETQLSVEQNKNTTTVAEYEQKITYLNKVITNLKVSSKETYVKVVFPDGTIEERRVTEMDSTELQSISNEVQMEYEQRLRIAEEQWKKVHESSITQLSETYQKQVSQYTEEIRTRDERIKLLTNPKKFGLELGVGYADEKFTYVHTTYDVLGPWFVGGLMELRGKDVSGGVGVGIRL